uniref:Uncharacterized protein n=1 Tax=Kuetzingia canaliculata TaxID=228262 RepID=A0A1Z1MNZ6_KUECA|nr:hypothetical protein [Kuetzingia canaliculata]ARW67823.1 hypothetical protein [Kuetzingia canaliculata]
MLYIILIIYKYYIKRFRNCLLELESVILLVLTSM